ncbi:fluoride efflux transporter FluC [Hoyosella altamirensis]|uniref:Fluoride-specific ion channel FluC n=1 Tax=Hoyosella altamirensis TaxID=616997 RepID=A0A839RTK4_9ACTN|nr:CrcB family protein [Hoyosella altamirensis]MBB3039548.1 CrcB protein [Hoyosella altamirensis]
MSRDTRHASVFRGQWGVLGVVAFGGVLGAFARYALSLAWPAPPAAIPWHTFIANATGSALIGVTIVLVSEVRTAHRLMRPFLGTGVLGGFTTFSIYTAEIVELMEHGRIFAAAGYLSLTLAAALAGVWAAIRVTRTIASRPRGGNE